MKTSIFRRGISGLLAVLMTFTALMGIGTTTAFAASTAGETAESYSVGFPRDGDVNLDYSGTWGHDELHYMNGWTSGEATWMTTLHTIGSFDGQACYCIEPGVPRLLGKTYSHHGEDYWKNYPSDCNSTIDADTIKTLLGRIMQYGYQGNLSTSWRSQNDADADKLAHMMATQALVWETVVGERDANFNHVDPGSADAVKSVYRTSHPLYSRFSAYYDSIEDSVQKHTIVPSFMARSAGKAQTVELNWDGSCYSATLTDTNGVLGNYRFSANQTGVSFSVQGNVLTISTQNAPTGTLRVTAEKEALRKGVVVWSDGHYGPDGTMQDVVTYSATVSDPVTAFLNLKVSYGGAKIIKTSEDGKVDGITFTITGEGVNQSVTTDRNGEIRIDNLMPGIYTVTEQSYDKYVPQESHRVTVLTGQTATVSFNNVLRRGDLTVTKTSEDGLNQGIKFHLFGTSLSGLNVDEFAVTDENGVATFRDVLIGTGYTLEEMNTAIRYVVPDSQSAAVEWNSVTNKSFSNILKKFNVTVTKSDCETGTAQGDASLAGAAYGIYKGDQLVDTYYTDENGQFITGYYVCGDDWTIREISPSEGYLLDSTVYPVGAEAANYTVELNAAPAVAVTEQVQKGNIAIIKHSDNGDTQIETPEEGAVFAVYLKSAGSYEAAKDTERDYLTCDENGFAQSKDLPYGVYTVHQVSGWEGRELMSDFDVFIAKDGETYRYLINNANFESFIKIIKVDAETGNTIPYAGAGFQIFRPDGSKVEMTFTYPEVTTIDTFYTNDAGMLITPEKLEFGKGYSLKEVSAPYGYVLSHEAVKFDVTEENSTEESGVTIVAVKLGNYAQKGIIKISKTGEVFASVTAADGVYQPVYAVQGLAGATYEIKATEDIYTPDGTLRCSTGDVVDTVTTGADGTAESKPLYLGKYEITEMKAPDGMVVNKGAHTAELVYAGQEIEITEIAASFCNDRQKARISLSKVLEQNKQFGIGMNNELSAVTFGFYAAEELTAADGSVIPADGLIEILSLDENGKAVLKSDVPFGSYYVKEISTDSHYILSDEKYPVIFAYAGQEIPVVELAVNDGKSITNEMIYGDIHGMKKDEDGKALAGATIGLFLTDGTEPILTTVSAEDGSFTFADIPYGEYVVREIAAPEGYVMDDTPYSVKVDQNGAVIEIEITNKLIRGSVQLTKVDKDYPDHHLSGAVFEVYRDGKLVGQMEELSDSVYKLDNLPYGDYTLKETEAPKGFFLDEKTYSFSIKEDGKTVVVENEAGKGFVNQAQTGGIRIEKTSDDGVLKGFTFRVEGTDITGNDFSKDFVTDEKGQIHIEGLRIGDYVISEVSNKANEKYELPANVTVTVHEGKTVVAKFHNKLKPVTDIHDYFFARTLDKVRPGGVIAFITSKGTMDKENPNVRKYIAQRADLLGAIRLPNDTFKAAAGTEVTSDIIFLQKRDRLVDIEPDWVHLATDANGIRMNAYFVDNPEMVLGDMQMVSGPHGMESACIAYENAELGDLLRDAIQNIHAEITEFEIDDLEAEDEDLSIPADPDVRNFSFTVVDGKIYYRENSRMNPVDVSATAESRIKGMIAIRDCVRTLIEYQTEDYPDADIKAEQEKLNRLYDDFSKKYGLISARANNSAFNSDSSYCLLASLEVLDDEGNFLRKADMFSKRTIKQKVTVQSVDTASEAYALSLAEKARIDMPYMSQLTGKNEQELFEDLKGVISLNPMHISEEDGKPKYLPADEYLSGNVREKLRWAKQSAELYPEDYGENVRALEAVQPVDLTASEISVRLGATWLPPEIIEEFMFELFSTPRYCQWNIHVHYAQYTGEWNVEGKSYDRSNVKAHNTYGTGRVNGYKIMEETLNLRDVRIFDYIEDGNGRKTAVLNKKETAIAQGKQELIKQAFADWIWSDPERREALTKLYNEKFNSIRPREYDGSHLNFVGINPEITLRPHQVNAIAHILYGSNTLLAHVVGAGKTFEMVAAAQESKRLGLCQKSLFVVPNHLTEQWASEYLQLYPSANILVATKKDFEAKNRKKFCGRIATGDYDAVIIGHSQFEKIPMSLERQRAILQQQLDEVLDGISELKKNRGDNFSIKQLERTKKTVKQKLDKLNDQSRKDDVVTFEELGVDRIFIDEAHYYKNLAAFTKMRNVGGISQTEAMKSSDLYMKCRYLDELTGGRGVVFATGTPISNSMVEMYTMQKYLQYSTLKRNDLLHFDAWASTFGETVTAIELSPEGTGYRAKTRFAKFYNLPELMAMFKETADIQTADMLKLPVPEAHYHSVVLKPSETQKEMVASLSERAERVRNKMVDSSVDNMLLITNDGRKLALDQRLMNDMLPDSETSKVGACAENVFDIWQRTADRKSTQMVFCDLSTPHGDGKFNVYDDLRNKLIAKGVPAEEIAYIHTANSEAQKKELFGKVRSGQVRVLIGSTQKMGAGTNVQTKLAALHHLDCPWRPSDLQQREGRIIRQGNENKEVDIYTYVTENTFDSDLYQLVESKQKFIGQIMTSKSPVRSAEDIDETALSYAEIKALCAGDPHIKEKMDLDIDVSRLKLLKANHLSQRYSLEDQILKEFPQKIKSLEQRIEGYRADIDQRKRNTEPNEDGFSPMFMPGGTVREKKAAGDAILGLCKSMTSPDPIPIGQYRGFDMELSFDTFSREYKITLIHQLRHTVTLGTDTFGNIQRLDNTLGAFEERMAACVEQLENTRVQLENAKAEVQKPFPQEEELKTKSARLNELNAMLNLDKRENEIVDGERGEEEPSRSSDDRER